MLNSRIKLIESFRKQGNEILAYNSALLQRMSARNVTPEEQNAIFLGINGSFTRTLGLIPLAFKCKKNIDPLIRFLFVLTSQFDKSFGVSQNIPAKEILASLHRKILKLIGNSTELSKETIGTIAYTGCMIHQQLAIRATLDIVNPNYDRANYYINLASECADYLHPDIAALAHLSENVNRSVLKKQILSARNLILLQSYQSKGHDSYAFLLKCIDNCPMFHYVHFDQSHDQLTKFISKKQYSMFLYFVSRLQNLLNNFGTSETDKESKVNLLELLAKHESNINLAKQGLLAEFEAHFQNKSLSGLQLTFANNELKMVFDDSVNTMNSQSAQFLIRKLQAKGLEVTLDGKTFALTNVLHHSLESLDQAIQKIHSKMTCTQAPAKRQNAFVPAPAAPAVAEITPERQSASYSTYSSAATTCVSDDNSTKKKVKTRGAAVAAPTSTTESDDSEEEKVMLTKRGLGFAMDESETDEPVYEITGDCILKGVYFAYKDLSSIDCRHLSQDHIKRHERLIREGHVVAPGKQGLRYIQVDGETAFKTTIPSEDARVIMTVEQEKTTDDGRRIFLYRPSSVRLHNQNKRNG